MSNNINYEQVKNQALKDFGVVKFEDFDPKNAVRDRINYLKNFIKGNNLKAIILGISGGVDSSTAGKLSQIAMQELRDEGYEAQFVAVRLPAGVQKDESDAQDALKFINPDKIHTINIGQTANLLSDEGLNSFENEQKSKFTPFQIDFNKGNIKARLRMVAQYQLAAFYKGVVLGTDHNSEGLVAFYTKHGDGACDLIVLNGLNKRQVRACAKELGAPERLYQKPATADLEELNEQLLDEVALGISYDDIDDFLEGKEVQKEVEDKIIRQFRITEHKRHMPQGFFKLNLNRK